jgi:uncharacterized membrane protein
MTGFSFILLLLMGGLAIVMIGSLWWSVSQHGGDIEHYEARFAACQRLDKRFIRGEISLEEYEKSRAWLGC